MTDLASVTGLSPEQEEAMHTPAQPEPDTEDIPAVVPEEAKPKRKRRTKAEMEAARLAAEEGDKREDTGASLAQIAALNCETPEDEIGYRPADFRNLTGKQLAYIDARYVMDVLDREVGPHNWGTRYTVVEMGDTSGVECTVWVNQSGYGQVEKTDVGTASTIEALKGAYSDAFKRAAVHFGIARDLYDERMAEAPAPAPAPVPVAQTIAAQTAAAPVAAVPVAEVPVNDPATVVEAWTCPVHGTGRIQPGGVSRRTSKPYSAFWVCTERGCDQTGGNA